MKTGSFALRLGLGGIGGALLVLIVAFLLPEAGSRSVFVVRFVLLAPLTLGVLAGISLPGAVARRRFERRWLPEAEGVRRVPEFAREAEFLRGLRELTGPLHPPRRASERLSEYLAAWARTALHAGWREEWVWPLLRLAWPHLRGEREMVDAVRALLLAGEGLPLDALRLALELLPANVEGDPLALWVAHESLRFDDEELRAEEAAAVERAWVEAYRREETPDREILQRLVRRFLERQRRDETAGMVYADAHAAGLRPLRLREEMRAVAEALRRRGENLDLAEHLVSLAGGLEAAPAVPGRVIERPPGGWRSTLAETPVETETGAAGGEEAGEPVPAAAADEGVTLPGEKARRRTYTAVPISSLRRERWALPGRLRDLFAAMRSAGRKRERPAARRTLPRVGARPLLYVAGGLAAVILVVLALRGFAPSREAAPSPGLSPPGAVRSQEPYTVQVAAHRDRDAAIRHLSLLRSRGVDAYYVASGEPSPRWYRIRVGRFSATAQARAFADSLVAAGVIQEYYIAQFEPGEIPTGAQP